MSKIIPANEKIDLRRGIDHIGVGAGAIIHDGKGNVLLMKRGPKARDENGRWDICGGAIEFGESIDETIKREIKEELCADAIEIDFLKVYDVHREHSGNKTHWVQILHAVKVNPKQVKIGEPHKISEIRWFNSNNLPDPLHSQFFKAFQAGVERGIVK